MTEQSKKPFFQGLIVWTVAIMAGLTFLGAVLDAVSNALSLITPMVTYTGTAVIVSGWLVAQLLLKRYPLHWKTTDGTLIYVKHIGFAESLPLVGMVMLLWIPLINSPMLSLNCPSRIEREIAKIYGTAPPGSRIALYIHPIDGSSKYWLRGDGKIEVRADGTWGYLARFGNPFGIGHNKPWPDYDVYAVALHGKTSPPKETDIAKLDNAVHCRVKRDPEPAIACKGLAPKIVSPKPMSCPFAAGYLVDPTCDPRELTEVRSPVFFNWEPEVVAFAELYHDGRPVNALVNKANYRFNGNSLLESGLSVSLLPGEYELKIGKQQDASCKTSAWFRVVRN